MFYDEYCRVAIDLLSLKMSFFNETDVNKPSTLLESYLASPELDFKDIIGMICDFLLAGIDTVYITIFYAKLFDLTILIFRQLILPHLFYTTWQQIQMLKSN